MNLMEKLAVNKWLVERDEAVVKVAELEAYIRVTEDEPLSKLKSDAIREMRGDFLTEFGTGKYIYGLLAEWMKQYADNLEKE